MQGILDKYQDTVLQNIYLAIILNKHTHIAAVKEKDSKKYALYNVENKNFITDFICDECYPTTGNLMLCFANGKRRYLNKEGITVWKER